MAKGSEGEGLFEGLQMRQAVEEIGAAAAAGEPETGIRARLAALTSEQLAPRVTKYKKTVEGYEESLRNAMGEQTPPADKDKAIFGALLKVPELINDKPEAMEKILDGLSATWEISKAIGQGAWDDIKQGTAVVYKEMSKVAKVISEKLKPVGTAIKEMFKAMGVGLMKIPGMKKFVGACERAAKKVGTAMQEMGTSLREGFNEGMAGGLRKVEQGAKKVERGAASGARGFENKVEKAKLRKHLVALKDTDAIKTAAAGLKKVGMKAVGDKEAARLTTAKAQYIEDQKSKGRGA
jgi:hypothetical protein